MSLIGVIAGGDLAKPAEQRQTGWLVYITGMLLLYVDLFVVLALTIAVGTFMSILRDGTGFFIFIIFAFASVVYFGVTVIIAATSLAFTQWTLFAASVVKLFAFVILAPVCFHAGDYVHLAIDYPSYRCEIDAQAVGATTPLRFNWGNKALLVTDGYEGETLVYDPTDALASVDEIRPSDHQFSETSTRHLIGHFYIERESPN